MYRRTMWYGLIAAAILLAMTITAVSAATYTDPKGRFTVAIPSGWRQENDADPFDLSFAAPGKREAGFGIITSDEPLPGDSAYLVENFLDALGDIFDEPDAFTIHPTTLGGQPAQRADGRGHIDDKPLRITIVAAVVGGTTYVVFFAASEAEYPAAGAESQAIFDTFASSKLSVVTPALPAPSLPPAIIRRLGDG